MKNLNRKIAAERPSKLGRGPIKGAMGFVEVSTALFLVTIMTRIMRYKNE